MTLMLETDIGYLLDTNGQNPNGKPECFFDATAPGRIGRGRERDRLLLQMHFQSGAPESQSYSEFLALAHRYYFGTPGSVTAASRAAIHAVNRLMLEGNRAGGSPPLQAGLTCTVMRGSELYVTQGGPGKTLVLRQNSAEQFPEMSRTIRPLGMADKTEVHYYHTMLAGGDLLWMGQHGPGDGKMAVARFSGNGDWHAALVYLREITNGNAPALICRFCMTGEKGQLEAAITASAQVAAVVESRVGIEREPESKPLVAHRSHESELIVDTAGDPPAAAALSQKPVLSSEDALKITSDQELAAQDLFLPYSHLIDGEHDAMTAAASPVTPGLNNATEKDPPIDVVLESEPAQPETSSAGPEEIAPASVAPERAAVSTNGSSPEIEGLSADVLKPMMISAGPKVEPRRRVRRRKEKATVRRHKSASVNSQVGPAVAMARQWYLRLPLTAFHDQVESGAASLQQSLGGAIQKLIARVLPGTVAEVQLPASSLLWLAVGVPVLVVVLTIAAYIQFGQAREFNYYLDEARAAATVARAAPDAGLGVPYWRRVLEWTGQAADIRDNHPEVAALEQAAQGVLDGADRVERVNVEAIAAQGFRADANLVKIIARGSSVYALDETNQSVYRAVLTTSGEYQLDPVFECHRGLVGMQPIEELVDITWLSRPNVVGQDTLLALDPGGRLLYCTTDGVMAATVLAPPYDGWAAPVAIEAFQNRIYVLEPDANEIWVYEREDKFFSNPPERYFSESSIDLSRALDISIVQGTVFILHRDGHMTQCVRREQGDAPECSIETRYSDGRPGRTDDIRFDGLVAPTAMVAYAPPHSSLYMTDANSPGAYQFSLRLAYQREFRAVDENGEITASSFAVGSGKDLFFASGNNVYVGRRR